MESIFTISLDFELHWGVFDKRNRDARKHCYETTRKLVPQMLHLFSTHGVGVTWATVGSLFAENFESWQTANPQDLPTYANAKYNAYQFVLKNGISEADEMAHFAKDLVAMIPKFEKQELASHTFAHYYCLEAGQTISQFSADLEAAQLASEKLTGKRLRSLVFPRNQYNGAYLKAVHEAGFTAIRSNPAYWYWTGVGNDETSLARKIFRTGDTFVGMGSKSYPFSQLIVRPNWPLEIPASRLLRQFDPSLSVLNKIRLRRIKQEMTYAATHNECYHLWWHPENFGEHPEQCMLELGAILDHYDRLRREFRMTSLNMAEITDLAKAS